MRGYVQSRTKGSWTIWVELDRDPSNGKRRRKTATFHGTKKQAEAALREFPASRSVALTSAASRSPRERSGLSTAGRATLGWKRKKPASLTFTGVCAIG